MLKVASTAEVEANKLGQVILAELARLEKGLVEFLAFVLVA